MICDFWKEYTQLFFSQKRKLRQLIIPFDTEVFFSLKNKKGSKNLKIWITLWTLYFEDFLDSRVQGLEGLVIVFYRGLGGTFLDDLWLNRIYFWLKFKRNIVVRKNIRNGFLGIDTAVKCKKREREYGSLQSYLSYDRFDVRLGFDWGLRSIFFDDRTFFWHL